MKKIYYLCLTCLIVSATSVSAGIFSSPAGGSVESAFLSVESSVDSASAVKLAGIHAMSDEGGVSFKSPKSTGCGIGYKSYNGRCILNCDRAAYPFASKPSDEKGTYTTCVGETTYYGYTSCKTGWTLKGHDCVESSCSGYPYATNPGTTMGTTATCKSGTATYYKYTACNSGWTLKSGMCEPSKCLQADYPYPSNPGSDAGTLISCKTGESTLYGYSACNAGWTKSGNYCNKVNCSAAIYPYGTAPSSTVGTVVSCKTGNDTYYGYSVCNDGWTQTGGYCNANICEGFGASSTSISGCLTTASCKKGTSTVYKCATCKEGYKTSSTGTCVAEACTGYTQSSASITGCSVAKKCAKGDGYAYKCEDCLAGYSLNANGTCDADACSGYSSTTPKITGCSSAESCKKGTSVVYKCTICEKGYSMNSSGVCAENACNGFSSTTANITGCMESESCEVGGSMKYKCAKCQEGYTLTSSGTCTANTCASPYSTARCTVDNCVDYDFCMAGATKNCKCKTCKDGFTVNGSGTCTANTCTGFGSTTASIANCMETEFCMAGNTKKYKCVKCQVGDTSNYTMNSSGGCDPTPCADKFSSTAPSINGCLETEFCISGTTKKYTCSVCKDGWTLQTSGTNIGKCVANTCADPYSTARCTVDNCVEYDTCMAGDTKTCKCRICKDGFTVNSSGTCTANACTGFATTMPDYCMEKEYCMAGNEKRVKCVKCQDGYTINAQNSCSANTCAGKYSSSSPSITGCVETEFCLSGTAKRYACTVCKEGYTLNSSGTCTANKCTSPFTSLEALEGCVEYDTCMAGESKYIKCVACKDGYTLNANTAKCVANTCSGYGSLNDKIVACMETVTCLEGGVKKYNCVKCQDGFTLQSDGSCKANTCATEYSATSPSMTGCMETEFCQAGADKKYKCVKCQEGYTLKNSACQTNSCDGYSATAVTALSGCQEPEFCMAGAIKKFKCVKCAEGYSLNAGTCQENSCPGYTANSPAITGCLETDSCMKGTTPKHKCLMCKDGYTFSNGTCTANACDGYGSTQAIAHCEETEFCMNGETKKFKCIMCQNGYYMDTDGTCKDCAYWANLIDQILRYMKGQSTTMTVAEIDVNGNGSVNVADIRSAIVKAQDFGCNTCGDYTSDDQNITGCKETDFCMFGTRKKFKCAVCQEGYTLNENDGTCSPNTCPDVYQPKSNMIGCQVIGSTCKSGDTELYTCSQCEAGYSLDGPRCRANHCEGFTLTSDQKSGSFCNKFSQCQQGNIILHKCQGCIPGYEYKIIRKETYVYGNGSYAQDYNIYGCVIDEICDNNSDEAISWHTADEMINCTNVNKHQCHDFVKYQCKACKSGYTLTDDNVCASSSTCSGYKLTSCPTHAISCSTCEKDDGTEMYKIDRCEEGYHETYNNCVASPTSTSCVPGYILYSDGTCDANKRTDKMATGVVVSSDLRVAVSIGGAYNTYNKYDTYPAEPGQNVPGLSNYLTKEEALTDITGEASSYVIYEYTNNEGTPTSLYPAAYACFTASTSTVYGQNSNVYLPTAGELYEMYKHYAAVKAGFQKLGLTAPAGKYWTITEKSPGGAWTVNVENGDVVPFGKSSNLHTLCFFKW